MSYQFAKIRTTILVGMVVSIGLAENMACAQKSSMDQHKTYSGKATIQILSQQTIQDVGAAQGVECRDDTIYVYGDGKDNGKIRPFVLTSDDKLKGAGETLQLTRNGKDLLPHPTGLTTHSSFGTFIGTTVNQQGLIYKINWGKLKRDGNLNRAVQHSIKDDAAANGTRPEFVRLNDKWLIATADYGDKNNEIRLYDPSKLAKGTNTTDPGVLIARFPSTPFVQSMNWIDDKGLLVLAQNITPGRGWQLSFIDLEKSVQEGKAVTVQKIDLQNSSELEGFHMISDDKALLVSSYRKDNATVVALKWSSN